MLPKGHIAGGGLALALALAFAHLQSASATTLDTCPPRPQSLPEAFDGLYLNPSPGPGVPGTEWYWFQAASPQLPNGVIPSIEAIFYYGFAFTLGPDDPPYRFDVSGVFPNGSTFFVSTPVDSMPLLNTKGQDVSGDWGSLGHFAVFNDLQEVMVAFDVPGSGNSAGADASIKGGMAWHNAGTPPHGPCSDCTTVPPFFSPVAEGLDLSETEEILLRELGWAIIIPRANVVVNVTIGDTPLVLEDAIGYHDKNWMPAGLDKFAWSYIFGSGSCGPFDVSYAEAQALGSGRDMDLTKGFLAYDGEILQNQCSRFSENSTAATDTMTYTLTGQTTDAVTGQQVPTGIVVDFTLANGTQYSFTLENGVENPAQPVYHRWRLGGKGGRVGGPQYSCSIIGDWLSPAGAVYSEDGNIFNEQKPEP